MGMAGTVPAPRLRSTVVNEARRRGRPSGDTTARADILQVARRLFLVGGYDRVTLRAIAAQAGVDVALISYYFGSKKGLFGSAMALAANPAEILVREIAGPLNSLPERVLTTVVDAWEDPETGASLRRFLEAVVRDPDVARLFRELIEREMIPRIAHRINGAGAERRAAAAVSHVTGLVMARYVLRLEPLASMAPADVVRQVAPSLRAALLGPGSHRRLSPSGRAHHLGGVGVQLDRPVSAYHHGAADVDQVSPDRAVGFEGEDHPGL
jgi:AcrR family transcriptional regulator